MSTERLVQDFITPLREGGKDAPENIQYLTEEQHREKTRAEHAHLSGEAGYYE